MNYNRIRQQIEEEISLKMQLRIQLLTVHSKMMSPINSINIISFTLQIVMALKIPIPPPEQLIKHLNLPAEFSRIFFEVLNPPIQSENQNHNYYTLRQHRSPLEHGEKQKKKE